MTQMDEGDTVSSLKKTLQIICRNNGWSYGVFWRFDDRNSMLLAMEDFHYEQQLGMLVHNMLPKIHILGEGAVGQAAFTGKHRWMLSDRGSGDNISASTGSAEDDAEFQQQFSVGIKTIAVIPVERVGVALFGSTKKIFQRFEFLDKMKMMLRKVKNIDGTTIETNDPSSSGSENWELDGFFASLLLPGNSDYWTLNTLQSCENVKLNNNSFGSSASRNQFLASVHCQGSAVLDDVCFETPSTLDSFNPFLLSEIGYENAIGHCKETFDSVSTTTDLFHGEESLFNGFRNSTGNQFSTDSSSAVPADDIIQWYASAAEQPFHDNLSHLNGFSSLSSSFIERESEVFPMQSSVTDLSHSDVQENSMDYLGLDFVSDQQTKPDISSTGHFNGGLFSKLGLEKLLNGLKTSNSYTKSCLEEELSSNCKRRRLESSVSIEPSGNGLTSDKEVPKSLVGMWIDDGYSINAKSAVTAHSQKYPEPAKLTKKRARPGESGRPRPKDRQQIQDRFKELKGIIPNGGKCSIDALLDKTIKYMLFLQNVTEYADNLKQANKHKDNGHGQAPKGTREKIGGATWALEVDGKTMVCPIKVEDLAGRGQMLIEMVCEEREHCLEIADMIRRCGLTILKGVMEIQENKIWASFVVEAKKHITRIDVFWSLMHLLHPNKNTRENDSDSVVQPCNRIDNIERVGICNAKAY